MKKNKKISLPDLILTMIILVFCVSLWPLQAYNRQDLIDLNAVIIRVSNTTDFLKAIELSSVGQLWNSKEMKPFLNNQSLAQALKETLLQSVYSDSEKPDNKELSHLLWEESKLLKDELIVGISSQNQQGKENFFILAALDEPAYLKNKAIDERMAELDENLSTPYKQNFQGVDLFRTTRTKPDKTTESEWDAFYGGTLISSTSREWVEHCIIKLRKELPAALTGPPMLQLRIPGQVIKYILAPQDQAAHEEHNTMGKEKYAIFNALGLDQLKYISLDLILKPESMEFQFTVKTKGPAEKGIWTLLTREPIPLNHRLLYVPDDVYSYQVMRLDFNALWKELPEILKSINPQYVQYLKGFTDMFSQRYKIDLSRDVFGNLSDLITTFSRMQDLEKQILYAWQVCNPSAMEKLLAKLYGEGSFLEAQLQDHLEIHQLHGYKLYSFKITSIKPGDTPGKKSIYSGISVVDSALVFGSDQLVRSLIQATANNKPTISNTLYQLPEYTALMRKVPNDALGYVITDVSQLVQSLVGFIDNTKMLKIPETEKQQDKDNKQSNPLTEFFNKLRFDRLPPVDFMASFFSKGITYTRFEGNDLVTRGIFQYRQRK